MPSKEATLKQENANLRANVESLTKEIAALKASIEQQEAQSASQQEEPPEGYATRATANVTTEEENTLSYLSKEYHDLHDFRIAVKKELERLGKCVSELAIKVDNVAKAIDEFQAYSYRYNLKIVGVPEKGTNESADDTSGICVALFREMGADVSIDDIDTAHRVPGRNNSSQTRPKAIICKFVRRLARDKVMAKRADANKANPTALGFRDNVSLTAVRVFEHLTPRLQEVLYEANKFKTQYHYKYCWAKNGTVYLRKSDDSRAIRIKDVSDLTGIQR